MRATLIIRNDRGQLLDPQPTEPIPVDRESVLREVKRLRSVYGSTISIDSRNIVAARKAMEAEALTC